jgi:uncharacterized membrane protein
MKEESRSYLNKALHDARPFWVQPRFAVLVVSLLVVTLVIGMVVLALGHHFDTLKVLAGAFSSLFATIAGAFLAFWFALLQIQEQTRILNDAADERRRLEDAARRQALAFDMHREFSGEDMLRARTEASLLLDTNPDKSYLDLYTTLPEAQTRCLFVVSEFYDRLALSVSHHRIDITLVPELFGGYFVWWWIDALEARLVA